MVVVVHFIIKGIEFQHSISKPPTQVPTPPTITPRVSGTEFQRNTENSVHFHISTIGPFPYASLSTIMTILLLLNPITPPIATLTQVIPATIQSKIVGIIAFYLLILFSFRAVEPIVVLKQCCIDNGFLFSAFDLHCIPAQRKQIGRANSGVVVLSFGTTMDILAIATRIVIAIVLVILGIEPNSEIPSVETGTSLAVKNLFSFCAINPIVIFTQQQRIDNEFGIGLDCVLKQRKEIALTSPWESYNARQARKVSPSKSGDRQDGEQGESVIVQKINSQMMLTWHGTVIIFIMHL